jgi:hypothetical protein
MTRLDEPLVWLCSKEPSNRMHDETGMFLCTYLLTLAINLLLW